MKNYLTYLDQFDVHIQGTMIDLLQNFEVSRLNTVVRSSADRQQPRCRQISENPKDAWLILKTFSVKCQMN